MDKMFHNPIQLMVSRLRQERDRSQRHRRRGSPNNPTKVCCLIITSPHSKMTPKPMSTISILSNKNKLMRCHLNKKKVNHKNITITCIHSNISTKIILPNSINKKINRMRNRRSNKMVVRMLRKKLY
jgi:hypothetical protein